VSDQKMLNNVNKKFQARKERALFRPVLSTLAALFLSLYAAPALAQTDIAEFCSDGVSADNVTLVYHKNGKFKQTGPTTWAEIGNNGATFAFTEVRRDENTIYLEDKSRGVQIQLDHANKKIKYGGIGKDVNDLYSIAECGKADRVAKARAAMPKPGGENFKWDMSSFLLNMPLEMKENEQRPRGTPGGEPSQINIPGDGISGAATLTKLNVYHSDDRVYGWQLVYNYDGREGIETPIIGGDAGKKSTIELGAGGPLLQSVKGHYAYDNLADSSDLKNDLTAYYITPILTGLTIGVYKYGIQDLQSDNVPSELAFNDLIEFHEFGTKKETNTVGGKDGIGFDLSMFESIRNINACVSPLDRNGRVFAFGVQTYGMGPRPINLEVEDFCEASKVNWKSQPLGPPRIRKDNPLNTAEIEAANFDPYEYASGVFTKEEETFKVKKDENGNSTHRWISPRSIIAEFGDVVKITLGDINASVSMPLLTEPAKQRDDEDYAFQYSDGSSFLGVIFDDETIRISETESITEKYATLILEMGAGNKSYNGRYTEARLGDGKVAKRHRFRLDVAESAQSKEGLFEIASVITNTGHLHSGYNLTTIDPMDPRAMHGRKRIFDDSGAYQYYLDNIVNKAIPDGLKYIDIPKSEASEEAWELRSEVGFSEELSTSVGASSPIPQASVSASAKFGNTEGNTESKERMKTVATAKIQRFALITDIPNAKLSQQFSKQLKDIFGHIEAGRMEKAKQTAAATVETYGTHYANSLTFGGMAIRVEDKTSKSVADSFIKSRGTSASIGVSQNETTNRTRVDFEDFRSKKFMAVGGEAATSFEAWTANTNLVPVLYDLEALHKLVTPLIVQKVEQRWTISVSNETANTARKLLSEAESAYINQFPMPEPVSYEPKVYELKVDNLRCLDGGDDDDSIQIWGKGFIRYDHGGGLNQDKILFDTESNANWMTDLVGDDSLMLLIPCANTGRTDVDETILMWSRYDDHEVLKASFHLNVEERDMSSFDYDEDVNGSLTLEAPPEGFEPESWAAAIYEGGQDKNEYAPLIGIDYTWQRIK